MQDNSISFTSDLCIHSTTEQKTVFFFFSNHKEPNVCLKAHVKVIGCSNEGIMEHFKYAFER